MVILDEFSANMSVQLIGVPVSLTPADKFYR
jgi:hypothetical protein